MSKPCVADIAGKLTKAQREAFAYLSGEPTPFISIHVAAVTRRALVAKGLLIETKPGAVMGYYTWHLSRLGLAVRDHLIKEQEDGQ